MNVLKKIIFAFFILLVFPTVIFAAPVIKKPTPKTPIVATKSKIPVRVDTSEIESKIHAKAYVVIDRSTGIVLTEKNENLVWPIASTTKLMTAQIVLEKKESPKKIFGVLTEDDVGGAKLYVKNGDAFTIDDLFYSMLVGSANNAANALARSTGLTREEFVDAMNAKAKVFGLKSTVYVDPSGIDPANVSTPMELAKVADEAFKNVFIKKYASTPIRNVRMVNTGTIKKIQNTNWMLTKPAYNNGIVVAGKTGYLEESSWNFVTALRPKDNNAKKELLLVIFGSDSRAQSFADAKTLSSWAWKSYTW
ncbi:MAG: serine hydrolase [Candidatus Uhrbacteria bacterium]|nr:serine hydrolase [Candidatus Uhrbacteria bacterium]